jgi:UrcA family protein
MSRTINLTALAVSAALILAPAAIAQAGYSTTSVPVAHGDLNLATAAGARTALQRMKVAANRVCGGKPSPKQLAGIVRYDACVDGAMSRAVAALNIPTVTALYTGETDAQIAAR